MCPCRSISLAGVMTFWSGSPPVSIPWTSDWRSLRLEGKGESLSPQQPASQYPHQQTSKLYSSTHTLCTLTPAIYSTVSSLCSLSLQRLYDRCILDLDSCSGRFLQVCVVHFSLCVPVCVRERKRVGILHNPSLESCAGSSSKLNSTATHTYLPGHSMILLLPWLKWKSPCLFACRPLYCYECYYGPEIDPILFGEKKKNIRRSLISKWQLIS